MMVVVKFLCIGFIILMGKLFGYLMSDCLGGMWFGGGV